MAVSGTYVPGQVLTAAELNASIGGSWSRVANQSIPTGAFTAISWDTESADSSGFLTPTSSTLTIPSGLGGLYSFSAVMVNVSGSAGGVRLSIGGELCDFQTSAASARVTGTVVMPISSLATVTVSVFQNTGSSQNVTGNFYVRRVGPG